MSSTSDISSSHDMPSTNDISSSHNMSPSHDTSSSRDMSPGHCRPNPLETNPRAVAPHGFSKIRGGSTAMERDNAARSKFASFLLKIHIRNAPFCHPGSRLLIILPVSGFTEGGGTRINMVCF